MSVRQFALGLMLVASWAGANALAAPTRVQLEAMQSLRLRDPQAFVAGVRRLEAAPGPTDATARDQLQLLGAQALALESRHDEALDRADALAGAAASTELRLRAAALAVNIQAVSRDFLEGQKRLEALLAQIEPMPDSAVRRHVDLVAAVFYNQLGQSDIAQRHAERVLAGNADLVERCQASLQSLDARFARDPSRLGEREFDRVTAHCEESGSTLAIGFSELLRARWRTSQGDPARAVDELRARLPTIVATGYAPLRAEAHAQLADSLQKAGRLDDADAETEATLALTASLPSGLPLLMARRTRYEIALARGDTARALRELQAVMTAERAYQDEVRRLQEAYEAGRHESLARQQSLALLEQRNAQLRLEAESSARTTTLLTLLLAPGGLAVLGLLAWAWQSRREQRRQRRLAQIDPLTALWTRPHFTQQAAAMLATAERQAQPMALVLVDLDHFSNVNSRYGHLSGDRVLGDVGRALLEMQGTGTHFGRLGGEEFAVLLPGAGLDEGLAFAERCRAAIATLRVLALDGRTTITLTASFGVVSTTAAGHSLRQLLANADQALYRAKSAGRNRVAAAVVVPIASAEAAA
jgi:diguanylate cyclase (GGDEF)-like protein